MSPDNLDRLGRLGRFRSLRNPQVTFRAHKPYGGARDVADWSVVDTILSAGVASVADLARMMPGACAATCATALPSTANVVDARPASTLPAARRDDECASQRRRIAEGVAH